MALSAVYTNFGGMLVHENRGGTERQYVSDPLGSLAGELDSSQALTYTADYWPYGEIQTESGTNTSNWSFVGLLGYLKDLASLLYVRARHYLTQKARWLAVDPIWPAQDAYEYSRHNPTSMTDASGLQAKTQLPPNIPCCSIPFNPLSHAGQIFIDCNCKGAKIRVLDEDKAILKDAPCGKWIPADAIIIGEKPFERIWKIQGQTCVYLHCPKDDKYGCYVPTPDWLICKAAIKKYGSRFGIKTDPSEVTDFCKEFCDRKCPPPCRGYS